MARDIEAILRERKKKTALLDINPVVDAIMLHYVMDVLYVHFLKEHSLRADWKPNLELSAKKYLSRLPPAQVQLIATNAVTQANKIFGSELGSMIGIDVRHAVMAFAQMVLTLIDQNRYRFTDDALTLQSIGVVNEGVEERLADWNYVKSPVKYLYQGFMSRVDASGCFRVEADHVGVAHEVLR